MQYETDTCALQWEFVEPSPGVFNYTPGSIVANLATKNRQILRCHNLVWYSQLAPWVTTTTWTAASLSRALVQHITHEVSHWRSQCYAWDVVNEALNDDGSYRNNTFLQLLGPEYLKIAFAAAGAADPAAKLYYNDYNIEYAGPKATAAREKIVGFLQDAGIRIDGVGLESHFLVGETPSLEDQVENMQSFVRMGVDVAITELDVRMLNRPDEASLAQQTKDYQAAVGACLQVPRCVGITVWDFYDPVCWAVLVTPFCTSLCLGWWGFLCVDDG
jgi:endo-1,4-beta-xylanase